MLNSLNEGRLKLRSWRRLFLRQLYMDLL